MAENVDYAALLSKLGNLSPDQLASIINDANRLKREKVDGVPTHDATVVKIAQEITALALKLKIDASKIAQAVGRNMVPQLSLRAYPPRDPNAPTKPRKSRT